MTLINRRTALRGGFAATAASFLPLPGFAQSATPQRGGTLAYAQMSANRRSADATNARHPYFVVDANTRLQWNCLTWVDPNLNVQLEVATKIEPTDATLAVWDVTLREGVMFHSGKEMDASDVAASFDYHRQNAPFARQITKIEPVSKYVARFFLDAGNSEFAYVLAEYNSVIMPAAPVETIGMDGIGSGPFRIMESDPNRLLIAERFEDYWDGDKPYLDRVEIHNREGQQESALNGLRSGQFDAVLSIDARAAVQLADDPEFTVESAKGGYSYVIQLPKQEGSIFQDVRIRKAFALAIDREAIVRVAYGGKYGWVGNDSHLTAVNPAFVPMPEVHDVAKAKALLAEAGYPDGIDLGTLYWSPQLPDAAVYFQALQQSVKEAGITVTLEERPNDGYIPFRTGDPDLSKGNFHKFAMTAVGNRNPGISLFRMRGENVEAGYWSGAGHDRYMDLYRQAMVEPAAEKRLAIYAEMQGILVEETPAILPAGGDNFLVRRKTVHDMPFHSQIWSIRFDQVWKEA